MLYIQWLAASPNDPLNVIAFTSFEGIRKKEEDIFFNTSLLAGKNPYFCHSFCTTKLLYLPKANNFTYSSLFSLSYLMSDSTEYAFSLGFGLRKYFPYFKRTLGTNVFYDVKHFNLDKFHQIGLGFESLSFLEIRANFYFPITKILQSRIYYDFNDNRIIEVHTAKSLRAFEIEVGKRIHQNVLDGYFSIAPYFIFDGGSGIEYKLQLRWKSILYVGVNIYQDFACKAPIPKGLGETITGIIGINIPIGADSSDKKSTIRIPISRWDTIRTCLNIDYKEDD